MKKLLVLLFCVTVSLARAATVGPEIHHGAIVVVPLKGEINEAQFFFLRRTLKNAEAAGASAYIIEMDTYGGSLQTAVEMQAALMKAAVPTITYVDPNAGSAGSLIALSTRRIYMAPVSAIGAAAPVTGEGQDIQATMQGKIVSYFSGYFRSAAEKNGYNPELAEAFINKDKEVRVDKDVIHAAGSLLTLSAQEAIKPYAGKPLLAQGVASSVENLCTQAGLNSADIVRIDPSGFEQLAQWITAFASIFLMGGIFFAYLEFKTPGSAVAGVLSAICFLLFFAGHYIAGLTGYEVSAVFIVGVALVVIEFVLFPGVTVFAAVGVLLMLGALLFAMVDFYPERPFGLNFNEFLHPLGNLGLALLLAICAISLFARFFPSLPFFRRLVLPSANSAGPSLPPATAAAPLVKPGDLGTTRSILRPAGKADFAGALVDVVTEGVFIESGAPIRVLRTEGERVIVSEV